MANQQQRQLNLGPVVPATEQVSMDRIDHSVWNSLLSKYVDDAGGVNYAGLKASQTDSQALEGYIAQLSSASLTQNAARENQMAYWINAYNSVTMKGMLQEYPTTSIRNFTSEDGGYNIWKNLLLNVSGKQISLESIENKVLRPMGDPRIHFAIVCASKGCPRLLNEAYVGETLNDQLNKNELNFFSNPQNFQFDQANREIKLSSILKWYGSDFGADQATQLRTIAPYLPTEAAKQAASSNAVSVSYLEYDWNINEQPRSNAGSGSSMPATGSGRR
ncbi:DUF547 domain-containing protein [bacterium]|nr:DUF547 domain-containing protein [bacterium]